MISANEIASMVDIYVNPTPDSGYKGGHDGSPDDVRNRIVRNLVANGTTSQIIRFVSQIALERDWHASDVATDLCDKIDAEMKRMEIAIAGWTHVETDHD